MSFWSKTVEILNPVDALKEGQKPKEVNIEELIRGRRKRKINKLIRENKIDLYALARQIYRQYRAFVFLNELEISSKELAKVAAKLLYCGFNDFLNQVTNLNFEDLYQEAISCESFNELKNTESIKSNFITAIAIHGAENNVDSHYIFELADKVIELNVTEWLYKFAKKVKGAPIEKLAEALIKTGNAYYSYWFAKEVPNAPIDKLAEVIIASNNANYIYAFAEDIPNAPINDLINAFVTSKGAVEHTNKFVDWVIKVESISFEEIARKFIATNNPELITEFAIHAAKHNIYNNIIIELANSVIASNNAEYIYKFIKNVSNAPIDDLIQAIIDLNDLKYICLLVKDYHKLSKDNIKKLFDAIIRAFDIKNMPNDDITNLVAKLTLAEVFNETDFKFFLHYLTMVKCNNSLTDAGVIPAPLLEELNVSGNQKIITNK